MFKHRPVVLGRDVVRLVTDDDLKRVSGDPAKLVLVETGLDGNDHIPLDSEIAVADQPKREFRNLLFDTFSRLVKELDGGYDDQCAPAPVLPHSSGKSDNFYGLAGPGGLDHQAALGRAAAAARPDALGCLDHR